MDGSRIILDGGMGDLVRDVCCGGCQNGGAIAYIAQQGKLKPI